MSKIAQDFDKVISIDPALFNVLVDLILKIVGNDVITFGRACRICKAWYEKLLPYYESAKAYKENIQIPIPIWEGVGVHRVYEGVNYTRGSKLIVNKISMDNIPDLTFEIVRPRYDSCFLDTKMVYYDDGTCLLLVRECEYKNFLLINEYFGWIIDCRMIPTNSTRKAVILEYAQLYGYGELLCEGTPPSISLYHWQQCGSGTNKYLTLQECNK